MSGVGKSSVVAELRARGHRAVDTDDGWCEPLPDGRQRWRPDAMRELLDDHADGTGALFVAGCEENQVDFYPRFDHIVLLSAPRAVLVDRVTRRSTNRYGKSPEELRRILDDLDTVEPLLRQGADHEVVTDVPLAEVVSAVLRVAGILPGVQESRRAEVSHAEESARGRAGPGRAGQL